MPSASRPAPRAGFTLVELSIVLVILGLLVGGVLTGQSLIHAAELRSVSKEFQNYQTALNTFRDKYFALPGDMPNAVRYWGAQTGATTDGVDSSCAALTTAATGTATCNGNGDGSIASSTSGPFHEMHRAWQHLANAGLIEGSYSGIAGPAGVTNTVPGTNAPRSKINNASWSLIGIGSYSNANVFAANYAGATLWFGAVYGAGFSQGPAIKAEDAYNLDMKMDDGQPHQGRILAYTNTFQPNCTVAANNAYNLASTSTQGCGLIFLTGY